MEIVILFCNTMTVVLMMMMMIMMKIKEIRQNLFRKHRKLLKRRSLKVILISFK